MSVIGLEVGGTWVRGVALDPGGFVGERVRQQTPRKPEDLAALLPAMWRRLGSAPVVGLASAPELDARGIIRRWASSPHHLGTDLLAQLAREGVSPGVIDDASAATVAEHITLTATDCEPSSTALISVGTGVGGGAVLDDRLWLGLGGQAMDLGHMVVPAAAGAKCGCGLFGCLQAIVSSAAVDRRAAEFGLPPGGVIDAAAQGDPRASEVFGPVARALGEAILVVQRVLAPDRFVLSGGLAEKGILRKGVVEFIRGVSCFTPVHDGIWGTWAGALGAAVEASRRAGESVYRLREGAAPAGHRVALVQGPNLNLLGEREPEHYGTQSLQDIEARLSALAEELHCHLYFVQGNGQEQLINWLQRRRKRLDGIIINPAGLTAHGHALRDTLTAARVPFIEVHLSNVYAREPLHRESCFADVACGRITGLGPLGYEAALRALLQVLEEQGGMRIAPDTR